MRKPIVDISILNWNGAKHTLSCLSALDKLIEYSQDEVDISIFVLDNNSSDDDWHELIKSHCGQAIADEYEN